MIELGIEGYWRNKLQGSSVTKASKLAGWAAGGTAPSGFIEPTLRLVEGDPATARLIVIAAPGAVGKSSYADALAGATQSVVVDLALTSPLGGNFFTGGLSNAFGSSTLVEIEKGSIALIVDALDEAQMRAGPQGYEAGLDDLASVSQTGDALPAVLLGRAIAAEDAYLYLAAKGHDVCLLEIQFFDDDQATRYIDGKLPLIAAHDAQSKSAFESHGQPFRELAHEARKRLIEVAGNDRERFAGYAPVLDAICEFTLQDGCLNPKSMIEKLSSSSPVALIQDIISSILHREQGKLQAQFRQRHPDVGDQLIETLYGPEEQLSRIAARLLGTKEPDSTSLPTPDLLTTYLEMVEQFEPQHPFVSSRRAASNPIFAAFILIWALRQSDKVDAARRAALEQPALVSPILFELYIYGLEGELPEIPLADVGILYQALNSQIAPGERVQLEISDAGEDNGLIEVNFEVIARNETENAESAGERCWGPYSTTSATMLELHSPFSNIYVDAPIMVQLGDGVVQQIASPTELLVECLAISAKRVLVTGAGSDSASEMQSVSLFASNADCDGVQNIDVKGNVSLSVSWEGVQAHPWTRFAVEVAAPSSDDIAFMRRRLRNILTAFRSHSKGALRRLAAKINHSRMTKDERGAALVRRLIDDGILVSVQTGKFYELDSGIMGARLGVAYNDLAKSRFTPELDSYLMDVLTWIKSNDR